MIQPSDSATNLSQPPHIVTASALVRNFGAWQDRAMTAPVYILKRGRARLVMLAADLIEQLGAPHPATHEWASERQPLLDALREVVILLDPERRVRFANNAAMGWFGAGVLGEPIDRLLPPGVGGFLGDVIGQVERSRLRDHVEVTLDESDARHLAMTIVPLAQGVALIGHDVSIARELAIANAALAAADSSLAILDNAAKVRINLRGYLVRPTLSLASMTGLSLAALSAARFVDVIDPASRDVTGSAIEQVIAKREPVRVEATLTVRNAPARPVSIALSPLVVGMSVDGVQAILLAR